MKLTNTNKLQKSGLKLAKHFFDVENAAVRLEIGKIWFSIMLIFAKLQWKDTTFVADANRTSTKSTPKAENTETINDVKSKLISLSLSKSLENL